MTPIFGARPWQSASEVGFFFDPQGYWILLARPTATQVSVDQSQHPAFPEFMRDSLSRAGLVAAAFEWCGPEAIPQPYRALLVHEVDMTSTLERHHGEAMTLEVLTDGRAGGYYFREVVLRGGRTGKAAEFGLIEIEIDRLPGNLREAILSGKKPLGGILNQSGLGYQSRPLGYFSVARMQLPPKLSLLGGNETFYGRLNQLLGADGGCIARILEIIPNSSKS